MKRYNGNDNAVFVSGNTGEGVVQSILEQSGMKFYHDLYIKDTSGRVSQIDFLAITGRALVCIEVKNYSKCVIKGDYETLYWTACYRSGNRNFLNPIKQNNAHVNACKSVLGEDLTVINIVVFSNSCNIRIEQPRSNNIGVVNMADLWYSLIDAKSNTSVKRLSKERNDSIVNILDSFDARSEELYAEHQSQHFNRRK